jgi:hypothetical protein
VGLTKTELMELCIANWSPKPHIMPAIFISER